MDKLNEKYTVTKENFVTLINTIATKRRITTQLSVTDSDFEIIKKLNKILLMLKIAKMTIGINILDDAISNLILIDKTKLTNEEIEKLYIYFYFYNNISDLEEIPPEFSEQNLRWQLIKIIQEDINLIHRFTYIDGNLYLNKK